MKDSGQKGQSLIELLVAVGLAVVLIGSLMSLSNASNRREAQARQANQASRLAQEGMELVRNISQINDTDKVVLMPYDPDLDKTWSKMFAHNLIGVVTYTLHSSGTPECLTTANSQSWCLHNHNDVDSFREIVRDQTTYTREVNIADDVGLSACNTATIGPTEAKQVTVRVSWDSPSGAQERSVTSCFTKK